MNANIIDTAVSILEKHLQAPSSPIIQSSNEINILTTAISIIEAYMAKSLPESKDISDKPIEQNNSRNVDGMLRRGPIDIDGKLSITSSSDKFKPPTETNIFSVNIAPKYVDDSVRPNDYIITPTINTILDKTNEIDALNNEIENQQKNIDTLTQKIKTASESISMSERIV